MGIFWLLQYSPLVLHFDPKKLSELEELFEFGESLVISQWNPKVMDIKSERVILVRMEHPLVCMEK